MKIRLELKSKVLDQIMMKSMHDSNELKSFCEEQEVKVENQVRAKIKNLRSKNGGEYA